MCLVKVKSACSLVTKGPALTLPVTSGEHRAFVVIDGAMTEGLFRYPEVQTLQLGLGEAPPSD